MYFLNFYDTSEIPLSTPLPACRASDPMAKKYGRFHLIYRRNQLLGNCLPELVYTARLHITATHRLCYYLL